MAERTPGRRGPGGPGRNEIYLDRSLEQVLIKRFAPYSFQVGILQNGPHYAAMEPTTRGKNKGKPRLKSFAGGPARRQSRTPDGTLAGVSKDVRRFLGFNYLMRPFEKDTPARSLIGQTMASLALSEGKIRSKRRLENLAQAIVRNPILSRKYGRNKRATAKRKGFNRKLIDTGQLFKAITAKVKISVSR